MSLLPSGAIETTGYDINNSLRFRSAASSYLLRTPASAGNRKTYTWSAWVKRGALNGGGSDMCLFNAGTTSPNYDGFRIKNDTISFYQGGAVSVNLESTQVFRDPSAWYHLVLVVDTTQATAANRVKIYVNGNQVTAFGTANYPSLNAEAAINNTLIHNIAAQYANTSSSSFLDGYMAEVNFIDGQALTPTSFGETDAVTGVWKAKKYTGTYGTNGFYLKFANDSSSLSAQYGAFLNGSTQHVSLTPTSAFNFSNNNWTIESFVWPNSQTTQVIFNYGYEGSSNRSMVIYYNGGNLNLAYSTNGSNNTDTSFGTHNMSLNTWYHVAIVRNGTTITAYVNGVPLATTINISTSSIHYPGTSGAFRIGRDSTNYLNGYLHGFRIVNGTAVYTSKFKPTTTKLTAITNTQLLTLQDATLIDNSTNNFTLTNNGSITLDFGVVPYAAPSIASDYSGNYNNWLIGSGGFNVNDISDQSYSVMYDSPTLTSATVANYAVMSPLDFASASGTLSAANLNWASSTNVCGNKSTIGATSGKWYWEAVGSSVTSGTIGGRFGFTGSDTIAAEQDKFGMYWHPTAGIARIVNGTNTYVTSAYTYTNSDVLALALDLDSNISYWYKNGVLQYTYDFSSYSTIGARVFHAYVWNASSGTPSWVYNFGQRPFKYTPRTNHLALNTYNLPDSTIKKGNSYMNAVLYTGNGSTNAITGVGFSPDFVWVKNRAAGEHHCLYDSVRGIYKQLYSNLTNAEDNATNSLLSFDSDGFTLGNNTTPNANGNAHVAWNWRGSDSTAVSNTSGSITSTVSVNATAGFSVSTFTTPSASHSNFTFGHGLGVAPKMVIVKSRSAATDWNVYHVSVGATKGLYLNQTLAAQTSTGFWQDTTPSSTLVYIGTGFAGSSETAVAYCWAAIPGYSAFGSYTGNGSTDGPFVYTGFRPKFLMIKVTNGTNEWIIVDSARATYNVIGNYLLASSSGAEGSGYVLVDFLSNGFKMRNNYAGWNGSSENIIYAAFAESPFKNSLAR